MPKRSRLERASLERKEASDSLIAKFDLGITPWRVLRAGLQGTSDIPNLAGGGPLIEGSAARLSLRGFQDAATTYLVLGVIDISLPFKGGTLVPSPDIVLSFPVDAEGATDLLFPWVGIPAGLALYAQVWTQDPGGALGWSASNALEMSAQ